MQHYPCGRCLCPIAANDTTGTDILIISFGEYANMIALFMVNHLSRRLYKFFYRSGVCVSLKVANRKNKLPAEYETLTNEPKAFTDDIR